jgi:eukaryotic-like serine/threonine-protein kinase
MDPQPGAAGQPESVGRYLIFDEIGVGGMASVHLGMLTGAVGFRRFVALKQLHSRFINDEDFVAQFINEARLAARIHHANVVQTLDVVWTGTQLVLVMEYVDGDTLNRVLRSAAERSVMVPIEVACSMVIGLLHGLHAAHEVRDEEGAPLGIVHRDVSPQNILIGRDGVARVLDFGVAKALAQSPNTQSGLLKGKFGYMAPEQILRGNVDRRTDVFAAGVVLWETLTCRRLFQSSKNIEQALSRVVAEEIPPPSAYRPDISPGLDAIVMRAVERDPERRFQSAEDLAVALEEGVTVASSHLVKTWFGPLASPELVQRVELIRTISKRYGPPGRATPHPSELTEEVRAALASNTLPPDSGARRDMPTVPPKQSGKFSLGLGAARARMQSGILPAAARALASRLTEDERIDPTERSRLPGPAAAHAAAEDGLASLLSARFIGGTLLVLVLLAATWVTAFGWTDPPTRLPPHFGSMDRVTPALKPAPSPQNGGVYRPQVQGLSEPAGATSGRLRDAARATEARPDPSSDDTSEATTSAGGAHMKSPERAAPGPSNLELRQNR